MRAFLVVFVLALTVRAGAIVLIDGPLPGRAARPARLGVAIDGYHEIALSLARGHGFSADPESGPTAARAPLYPVLVAALYRGFGARPAPVVWAQALLGALTCALIARLGARMYDRGTGLSAGILFAFYPPHVAWSWYVLSETLLVFLLVATCLALVRAIQAPTIPRALAAGAMFGATALCNSVIMIVPPVLVLAAALLPGRRRAHLRPAVIALVTMWAVVLPWTARNYAVFHRVIPVHWGAGWTYMKGAFMAERHLAEPRKPMWAVDQAATEDVMRILEAHGFGAGWRGQGPTRMSATGVAGIEEEEFLARWTRAWVLEHPLLAARKFVVDLGLYWYFSRNSLAYLALSLPLLVLALVGLARGAGRSAESKAVLLLALMIYLAYAMMLSCARYSLQVMPIVTVLAAAAVVDLARRAGGRSA